MKSKVKSIISDINVAINHITGKNIQKSIKNTQEKVMTLSIFNIIKTDSTKQLTDTTGCIELKNISKKGFLFRLNISYSFLYNFIYQIK